MECPNCISWLGCCFCRAAQPYVEQASTPWQELKQQTRQCFRMSRTTGNCKASRTRSRWAVLMTGMCTSNWRVSRICPLRKKRSPSGNGYPGSKSCYKLKAESYAYEPAGVAKWSAVKDGEQQSLLRSSPRGDLSYGQFAVRRLEIDTQYRGEITRAVSADYKRPENMPQKKDNVIPKTPSDSSSSCGWEGTQWVCRSL